MNESTLYPLVSAIEAVTGRRVHLSTALRWSQRKRGARLNTVMLGGRRCCTLLDVRNFIADRTNEDGSPIQNEARAATRSASKREKVVAEASKLLQRRVS